jgi:hypothetical protein
MFITAKGKIRMLSPDAKEKAEEVFQAYDRHITKVFDPELPDWRIPGKAAMGFVAIAAALAACGPVVTPKPTETSAATVVVTQTIDPTETKIPTVSLTPKTATPTETATPKPEYATKAEHPNDFTVVSSVEEAVKSKMARRTMNSPVTLDIDPVMEYEDGTYSGVFFTCKMGTNCANPEFIRVGDPANGPDRWYIMLEVRNPGDKESKILVFYIAPDGTGNDIPHGAQTFLEYFNKYSKKGTKFTLTIPMLLKWGSYTNPVLTDMSSAYNPQQLKDMKTNNTLPDSLNGVPLWAFSINLA